ncbi:spore germination protein [Salsuginibacillus halophilus]|uniref:Spore germination protein n=1 Tax=Salsuginibacillus halophilus TaxID=517424 RepID=A0A2P8HWC1_9BACI|nr:germination protein YpeB [Salsuginibacillus halophilus]PSL50474.1 spore germination protein [Salsuginibacillus halophilus]
MGKNAAIGVLAVLLAFAGVWLYQTHEAKESFALQQENSYQRAFHDFVYHIDQLEGELGAALAKNGAESRSGSLAEVWRLSQQAHAEVGQLPKGALPLQETDRFLNELGSFSYESAIQSREDGPMESEEEQALENFYAQAGELKEGMRHLQAEAMQQEISWVDVEAQAVNGGPEAESPLMVNFERVNHDVKGFSENEGAASGPFGSNEEDALADVLDGKEEISQNEAKQKALNFLDINDRAEVTIESLGDGAAYPGYQLEIQDPESSSVYMMDVTKQGGLPLWFMREKASGAHEETISLYEASEKAAAFIDERVEKEIALVDSKQYNHTGAFQFVPVIDGVRMYPFDLLVEVSLADGKVNGYQAIEFLAHEDASFETEPEISEEEAAEGMHKDIDVQESHIAVVEDKQDELVLTYEFIGTKGDDSFRIFMNAETGAEERVDKLPEAEPVYGASAN